MTKESPNLEIISNHSDQAGGSGGSVERRRFLRWNLSSEQFRLKENGKIFSVTDVSQGGMGIHLLDQEDHVLFPVGRHIEGTLNLRREKYPVKAQVRYHGKEQIGFLFEKISDQTQKALQNFLNPKWMGESLQLRPSSLQEGGHQGGLWYHGPPAADLIVWENPARFFLFVMGYFIQHEPDAGFRTGIFESGNQMPDVRGVLSLESVDLRPDAQPDPKKLDIAKILILSSNVTQEIKNLVK